MYICQVSAALRRFAFCLATLFCLLVCGLEHTRACECAWRGPFLSVYQDAPLVVYGRILRHNLGRHPTMDVLVLETLSGGMLDSGMRIQMGDGMHCRPEVWQFPVGTEYILAINGPGSKPGDGLALSICGEYWLRLDSTEVVGSIDGDQDEVQRMPFSTFRDLIWYPAFRNEYHGTLRDGETYRQSFGSRFEFVLQPTPLGWEIVVREWGRDENLARLTPPLHFAPNPREIEAWHIVEAPPSCPRPYDATTSLPFPREFIFSPQVGRSIDGPQATRPVTPEEIQTVRHFGQGILTIQHYEVHSDSSGCQHFSTIDFSVSLHGGYDSASPSGKKD